MYLKAESSSYRKTCHLKCWWGRWIVPGHLREETVSIWVKIVIRFSFLWAGYPTLFPCCPQSITASLAINLTSIVDSKKVRGDWYPANTFSRWSNISFYPRTFSRRDKFDFLFISSWLLLTFVKLEFQPLIKPNKELTNKIKSANVFITTRLHSCRFIFDCSILRRLKFKWTQLT